MAADKNSAIDDRTSDFLDVEQTARTLVSRLSRLDDEAKRYSEAATHLDQSAQATRELVAAIRGVGEEAAKALDVVSVGLRGDNMDEWGALCRISFLVDNVNS